MLLGVVLGFPYITYTRYLKPYNQPVDADTVHELLTSTEAQRLRAHQGHRLISSWDCVCTIFIERATKAFR